MKQSMNVLALIRNEQRFIFVYDDSSVTEVLSRLSASAADPELDFTWYDAAMLSQRVRRLNEDRFTDFEQDQYPFAA